MFDFLDEMPHHQRRDPPIAAVEQRIPIVENDPEEWGEGGLEVGDVSGVEFDRPSLDQLVISADAVLVTLLQARIALNQRQHVLAVRGAC